MIAGRIARSPDQTVGFWARRMALETVVHRVDAEQARGAVAPVDAALATDGIDEILVIMLAGDWSEDPDDALNGTSVGISAGSASWQVALERPSVEVGEPDSSPQRAVGEVPGEGAEPRGAHIERVRRRFVHVAPPPMLSALRHSDRQRSQTHRRNTLRTRSRRRRGTFAERRGQLLPQALGRSADRCHQVVLGSGVRGPVVRQAA
jgi:hypothetical protein